MRAVVAAGAADVVDIRDGTVTLALGGTCGGCPARGFTTHRRIGAEIRRLCPGLRAVEVL